MIYGFNSLQNSSCSSQRYKTSLDSDLLCCGLGCTEDHFPLHLKQKGSICRHTPTARKGGGYPGKCFRIECVLSTSATS